MLLVLNLPLVGLWVKILQIPRPYLYAGILVFAALGAFSVNFAPIDVGDPAGGRASSATSCAATAIPWRPWWWRMILGPDVRGAAAALAAALAERSRGPVLLAVRGVVYVSMALIFVGSWWLRRRQASLEAAPVKEELSV